MMPKSRMTMSKAKEMAKMPMKPMSKPMPKSMMDMPLPRAKRQNKKASKVIANFKKYN